MSRRTKLLSKLKYVYSHNTKLVLDVSNDDIGLIIEGVGKQIQKKPKNIMAYVSPFEVKDKYALCPICNMEVVESINWCPFCGQKLDWNENKEGFE